jgi:TetR/AcrR family transcriptional regulator
MATRVDDARAETDSDRAGDEPASPPEGPGRERILAAALDEFAGRGFDGTTTAEIARRAGVTQPLVHYHFESKDALWRAAVSEAFTSALSAFDGVMTELSDLDTLDQMKVLVRRFVRFCAAHPEIGRMISYEGVQGGPRLTWLLEHNLNGDFAWFRDLYDHAVAEGVVKDLPAEHVLTSFSAAGAYLFIVKAAMWQSYGMDVTDPAVIETHADTIVELFFHGLAVERPERASGASRAAGRQPTRSRPATTAGSAGGSDDEGRVAS